jgi:hypothetical protein
VWVLSVSVSVAVASVTFTGVPMSMMLVVLARHHGAVRHHVRARGGMVVMRVAGTMTRVCGAGRVHGDLLEA